MALEANTYVDVAEADTYHTNHNPGSQWGSASQAEKEAAINEATQWLETKPSWIGDIKASDQALAWPRDVTQDKNGRDIQTPYPKNVEIACFELALAALDGPLVQVVSRDDQAKRVKAGPVEVEYKDYGSAQRQLDNVRNLLSALTDGSTNSVPVVRVQ